MSKGSADPERFSRWIARPQSLIALSALLLSICGLFVAVYETSLIRREQRASVWPHLDVSASVTGREIEVRAHNVGVGPARVRSAVVARSGETKDSWVDLIREADIDLEQIGFYYSLIDGRVLPRDSAAEVIFRIEEDDGPAAPPVISWLGREILEGRVDVTLCYCSVYEECWTSSLQDVFRGARGDTTPLGERSVESCADAPRSAI